MPNLRRQTTLLFTLLYSGRGTPAPLPISPWLTTTVAGAICAVSLHFTLLANFVTLAVSLRELFTRKTSKNGRQAALLPAKGASCATPCLMCRSPPLRRGREGFGSSLTHTLPSPPLHWPQPLELAPTIVAFPRNDASWITVHGIAICCTLADPSMALYICHVMMC